jgi:protein gp37
MSDNTAIEWTDATWSPSTGCDRTSPGCDHCYALTLAKRLRAMGSAKYQTDGDPRTSGPGFGVAMHADSLSLPMAWRKSRKIFVNSMSDLFHAKITDEFIAQVFAVMAASPQHVFQILTKRHARMRSLLSSPAFGDMVWRAFVDLDHPGKDWETAERLLGDRATPRPMPPIPWVHLGVSVEDQHWAGIRIPALLATPAAVRWISAEPLLGPIDLSAWMPPISPMDPEKAPRTWADWAWPGWVPAEVRASVEGFWSESFGRGPQAWMRSMHEQGAPAFGSIVTMDDGFGRNAPQVTGRYVHAWNNIGRLAMDDDSFKYTSFGPRERGQQRGIKWVVAGGESGPGARPMDIEWARSLVAQCQQAHVPVHVKQLGAIWARANGARDRKGGTPDEWPTDLVVRQFPHAIPAQGRRPLEAVNSGA